MSTSCLSLILANSAATGTKLGLVYVALVAELTSCILSHNNIYSCMWIAPSCNPDYPEMQSRSISDREAWKSENPDLKSVGDFCNSKDVVQVELHRVKRLLTLRQPSCSSNSNIRLWSFMSWLYIIEYNSIIIT